ncbi:hypothetical protein O206_05495 [Ochrobactrum sp. EGD-AQ16]|nr:hypothetical protein O206_05495 [Ochrobactrum sp. EGD-AQ16]
MPDIEAQQKAALGKYIRQNNALEQLRLTGSATRGE